MGADRARNSYDPQRQYRSVVSQQGRVTLEADANEESRIQTEELRAETLDIVGPCGTPDDGYAVSASGTDLSIKQGTMYVGGWRVTQPKPVAYSKQPDWLDTADDPLWRPVQEVLKSGRAHVCLLLREQEIVATEDPVFRDPALGGPDSAARTRLLQRFVALPSDASDCAKAGAALDAFWLTHGLDHDPATAELTSFSRLKVSSVSTPPAPSPCDPPSQSGYLGADNQMIRVKLTGRERTINATRLLWAYNNASFLYRVRALDATTIEFQSSPVDDYHTPQIGQVVEILARAAELGDGAYAAATDGVTAKLAAAYAPDTRRLTLPSALPAELVKQQNLYLRIWDDEAAFTAGQPVELKGTGLAVTITSVSNRPLQFGAYWSFSVRPTTPNAVYPAHYLQAPQSPDGPRMWLCSLAVLGAATGTNGQVQVLDDCRLPFDNLVELTARHSDDCCCVTVSPGEGGGKLQAALDLLARTAAEQKAGATQAVLKLKPGEYKLQQPLRLDEKHNGIRIETCGRGVTVSAEKPEDEAFRHGLLLIAKAHQVSLHGIRFLLPMPRIRPEDAKGSLLAQLKEYRISIGIRTALCDELQITGCEFTFPNADRVLGAAVFLEGDTQEPRIEDCRFIGTPMPESQELPAQILCGILTGARPNSEVKELQTPPVLHGAVVRENAFVFLSFGILAIAKARRVVIERNTSRACWCSAALVSVGDKEVGGDLEKYSLTRMPEDDTRTEAFLDAFRRDIRTRIVNAMVNGSPDADWQFGSSTLRGRGTLKKAATGRTAEARIEAAINLAAQSSFNMAVPSTYMIAEAGVFVPIVVAASATPAGPALDLMISGNTLDSRGLSPSDVLSGPAVFLWDVAPDTISTAVLTANTLLNRSVRCPALLTYAIHASNITGNVVVNDMADKQGGDKGTPGKSRFALWIQPGGRDQLNDAQVLLFTVTGNTFLGSTNLAMWPRNEWRGAVGTPQGVPALLTWRFFNTEA